MQKPQDLPVWASQVFPMRLEVVLLKLGGHLICYRTDFDGLFFFPPKWWPIFWCPFRYSLERDLLSGEGWAHASLQTSARSHGATITVSWTISLKPFLEQPVSKVICCVHLPCFRDVREPAQYRELGQQAKQRTTWSSSTRLSSSALLMKTPVPVELKPQWQPQL